MEDKLLLTDFLYVSTLSDLGMSFGFESSMMKFDITPGVYELKEFYHGYVLAREDYTPDYKDIAKLLALRDGDKGLSGTFYSGETYNLNHMYLFNTWIRYHLDRRILDRYYSNAYYNAPDKCLTDEDWDSDASTDWVHHESEQKLKYLPDFNCLPVMFYLNRYLDEDDLLYISLCFPVSKELGNVQLVWRVVHEQHGDIGIAVQQKNFHRMLVGHIGFAILATASEQAIGNFDLFKIEDKEFFDSPVSDYSYTYQCKFDPCHCDFRYIIPAKPKPVYSMPKKNKKKKRKFFKKKEETVLENIGENKENVNDGQSNQAEGINNGKKKRKRRRFRKPGKSIMCPATTSKPNYC